MKKKIPELLKNHRMFLAFILLMAVFRGAIADWNVVPTGSMKPTIVEGDRILVNKLAYDINLPFSTLTLLTLGNPGRGDIVVFNSEKAGKRLVKRVVAVPGDVVSLHNNHLMINGESAKYQPLVRQITGEEKNILNSQSSMVSESIFGYSHPIRLMPSHQSPLQSFGPVKVPADHYLMMGDNRDNSADSRVYGFVPREEITGKAHRVLFSLDYNNYYLPRADRFNIPLL